MQNKPLSWGSPHDQCATNKLWTRLFKHGCTGLHSQAAGGTLPSLIKKLKILHMISSRRTTPWFKSTNPPAEQTTVMGLTAHPMSNEQAMDIAGQAWLYEPALPSSWWHPPLSDRKFENYTRGSHHPVVHVHKPPCRTNHCHGVHRTTNVQRTSYGHGCSSMVVRACTPKQMVAPSPL